MTAVTHISREQALSLLEEIATQLHRYGTPSHRLEGVLVALGAALGHEVSVFCVPTMITIAIGSGADQRSLMLRVEPGAPDLGRLASLLITLTNLRAGSLSPADALLEVRRIAAEPCGAPSWAVALAVGGSGFAAAQLFGGGWSEMWAAALVGTMTGAILTLTGRNRDRLPLSDFVAGALTSIGAAAVQLWHPIDASIVTVASLIVLVPGLSLATAMNELATRHLVSGTARTLGACMSLVALGFGAAIGDRIAALFRSLPTEATRAPWWTLPIALTVASLSIAILFRARRRDVGWVAMGAIAGYCGGWLGQSLIGAQLGACVGAAFVALTGNAIAKVRTMPAALVTLPGLLMLVPGTVAFRGLQSLMQHDVVGGLGIATTAVTVTGAIVAGLLVANVLLPAPRRL